MTRKYIIILALLLSNQFFSQTYEFKQKLTPKDKKEFLGLTKKIFSTNNQISYNFSNFDAATKFSEIPNQIIYNSEYLNKIKKLLAKDSLNPLYIQNFATYYENKGDKILAKKYFKKSLENLSHKVMTKKDSAFYYSFRGILKLNLEQDDAIFDIEKSLRINPNDSISMAFYPLFLMQKGKFIEARKICSDALDKKSKNPIYPFMLYSTSFLFENLNKIMDPSKKIENQKKSYTELIDYKSIFYYADLYKENTQIQSLKKVSEVLGLVLKFTQFEIDENNDNKIILNFKQEEIKKIQELHFEFTNLLKTKKLNTFSANKSLCILNFFLGQNEKAITNAKLAISIFPVAKRSNNFNTDEVYSNLNTLYCYKNDNINFEKTLLEKIEKTKEILKNPSDYLEMSKFYLQQNNLIKVDEWIEKAKELEPNNFEILRLIAHVKFMDNLFSLTQYYIEQASKQIKNEEENYNLNLQYAAYLILQEKENTAKIAFENIENYRKFKKEKCVLCDQLQEKYFKVTQ